eukprot:5435987-Amphidinium_carterae.3
MHNSLVAFSFTVSASLSKMRPMGKSLDTFVSLAYILLRQTFAWRLMHMPLLTVPPHHPDQADPSLGVRCMARS